MKEHKVSFGEELHVRFHEEHKHAHGEYPEGPEHHHGHKLEEHKRIKPFEKHTGL